MIRNLQTNTVQQIIIGDVPTYTISIDEDNIVIIEDVITNKKLTLHNDIAKTLSKFLVDNL